MGPTVSPMCCWASASGPVEKVVWCGQNSLEVVRAINALPKIGAVDGAAELPPHRGGGRLRGRQLRRGGGVRRRRAGGPVRAHRAHIPRVRHVIVFGGRPGPGMLSAEALLARARMPSPRWTSRATPAAPCSTPPAPPAGPRARCGSPADPAHTRPLLELVGHRPDDVYITDRAALSLRAARLHGHRQALGATVILQRRFDPEDWLRPRRPVPGEHYVLGADAHPADLRAARRGASRATTCSAMRRMIANAAPWSMALKEAYMRDFGEDSLWEVYGSTELGVDTVLGPPDHRRKPGSCGRAVPGVEIRLYDDAGAEGTDPDVPGEVFVRSVERLRRLLQGADKTAAQPPRGFATVGDIAYRDADGFYYICDRKTDMIISGGMNIYPAEIEAALEAHPDVADVAVFGIPSEEWGESVHAVVVARPAPTLTEDEVTAFAREHLAGYKMPRSVSWMDEMPKTGSGKILKRVLREPFWAGSRQQGVRRRPRRRQGRVCARARHKPWAARTSASRSRSGRRCQSCVDLHEEAR